MSTDNILSKAAHRPHTIIEPTHGWPWINLHELWSYRDLLFILAGRDIRLRYKQTILGIAWVILQPLVASLIFTVIFGYFAKLPSDGNPYLLFVFSGLLPWNLFAGTLSRAGNSLVTESKLVSKVYFPRMLIPMASAIACLIDFAVTLIIMILLIAIYGVSPTWHFLCLPYFLLLTIMAGYGVSLWLSAFNVYYRDFMYALPFIVQVWMYATPITYAMSIIPERWRLWYSLNPAVGLIEGFRWALLGKSVLTVEIIAVTTLSAIIVLISGVFVFRRFERNFADVL